MRQKPSMNKAGAHFVFSAMAVVALCMSQPPLLGQEPAENGFSEPLTNPIEVQRLQALTLTRKLQAEAALLKSYQDYASIIEELAQKWPLLEGVISTESEEDLALRKLLQDTYQQQSRRSVSRTPAAAQPAPPTISRTRALPEIPPYMLTINDIVMISCGTENTSRPRVMIRANSRPADLVLVGETFRERGKEFRLVAIHLLDDETLEAVFVHEGKELTFEDRITGFQGNNCSRKDA